MEETTMNEQESLRLITQMINKAKNSFYDTGVGPILWGSVVAFCSLVSWAERYYNFDLPFDIWLLTLVAILPQVYISIKEKKKRQAKSYNDVAMDYIWLCFGISIFLVIHINSAFVHQLADVYQEYKTATGKWPAFGLSSYASSLMLLLYGFPTIITGAIMKFKPMLWGGVACWLCCVISVYTTTTVDMLLTAFAAIVMWLVPGIILWRRFQKKKAAHV